MKPQRERTREPPSLPLYPQHVSDPPPLPSRCNPHQPLLLLLLLLLPILAWDCHQVAHIVTRNARRNLEFALKEVAANTAIAEKTRQKQMLLETLGVLVKLQGIVALEGRHG